MTVDVQEWATSANRREDDGSTTSRASSDTVHRVPRRPPDRRQGRAGATDPAPPVNATDEWYRRLGASHRRRDESLRLGARAVEERRHTQRTGCHDRWPPILAAMQALIDAYNDGAGEHTLSLVDGPGRHAGEATATVTARNGRALVLAIEDADLWVRAGQDGNGRAQGERWIGLNRSAEATAGYVLQNWLAHLEPCGSALRAHDERGGDV